MKPLIVVLILIATAIFDTASGAASGGALAAPLPALRAAVFNIPPYGMENTAGQVTGLYVELTRAIAIQAGYVPEIELAPFARVLARLSSGAADMAISFPTANSTEALLALEPVMAVDAIVVPRKGVSVSTRRDFAGKRVGRIRGGCIDMSNSTDISVELVDLNDFREGLRLLGLRRIDGLCTTREVFRYYLMKEMRHADEFGQPVVINHRDVWLFMRADASAVIQHKVRNAIEALRKRRVLDDIVRRYMP